VESPLFGAIRRAARQEELSALRAKASTDADYKALAEEYFEAADQSREELEKVLEENEELRARVLSLQYALQWKPDAQDEVEPETDTPPSTVEEAVLTAMSRFDDELAFGQSVDDGIKTLAPDAGPPDKILSYLTTLADYTHARRSNSMQTTTTKWLRDRGVIASREAETIRKSPKAQQGRTWEDGLGRRRVFDHHLKPTDGTAPDRCVRIYFEYDEESQKTAIGWVGTHL